MLPLTATAAAQEPLNGAPTAAFDVDPDPPTAGQAATLDAAASTDPDGDALSYAWDLDGDGHTDHTGVEVVTTFPEAGDVTVTLTVSDGDGATDVEQRTVTVNAPPEARFEVIVPAPPTVGASWTFDASNTTDPEGDALTYRWDLGDGTTTTGIEVSHAYDAPGTYDVTLTVTDEHGATNQHSAPIQVDNRAPTASLTVSPTTPTAGQDVIFDATGSSDPDGQTLTYDWDVDGDGTSDATTQTATYVTSYSRNAQQHGGPFRATVTVSDGALSDTSAVVEVTVANAAPTAVIAPVPERVDTTTEVTFDGSGSHDVESTQLDHAWDLGDGTTATGVTVGHTYAAPGTYTVTLTVSDPHGGTATATRVIEVTNAPPVIVVDPSDPQGRPGEAITIDASGSFDPDGRSLTFRWSPEDHPQSTGPTVTLRYPAEGLYRVELEATDADGAVATTSIRVRIDHDLVFRVAGGSRVETAVALSRQAFAQASGAILARADDFPDALAASTLAAEIDGPILLTGRDELSSMVADELVRLGVGHVYLAGGPAALGEGVEQGLRDRGIAFTRLAGSGRFETAAAIADEVVRLGGRFTEAVIALGAHVDPSRAWADALVAGNLSTTARAPVLLVTQDQLPRATRDALRRTVSGSTVWIAGGEAAVGPAVERALDAAGWTTRRLAGPNRYATAVVLADEARSRGTGTDPVVLASGHNFPDALAAAVTAWKLGGVLLLVDPDALTRSGATYGWLRHHRDAVDTVLLAGGLAAVGDHTRRQIEDRIEDGTSD